MNSETKRTRSGGYAQEWSAYNAAQTNEKHHFLILLHELCQLVDEPDQAFGRPRLSLSDMIFCMAYKVYSTFPGRRFTTDMQEAKEKGLILKVPHANSLSHYFRMEWLTPILTNLIEASSLPLEGFEQKIAVDSTGLTTCRYARWFDEREQRGRTKHEWIKLHLVCGVKTNIVMSVHVTSRRSNDSPHFGRLVAVAARNFKVAEVTADKGYLGSENMRQALVRGVMPYIPFKKNSCLDADFKSTFWKKMLYLYRYNQEEFMKHYNSRNNVESTIWMIKSKFGDRLRSKSPTAQFNEALCKVLCHNLCVLIQSMYELGIDLEFRAIDANDGDEASHQAIGDGRIVAGISKAKPDQQYLREREKRPSRTTQRSNQSQLRLFSEEQ